MDLKTVSAWRNQLSPIPVLLPLAAALGLVLIGLAFPLAAFERFLILLWGGLCAAAAMMVVAKRLHLGLAALIVAALLVPYELPTGTGTNLNPAFLLSPILIGFWLLSLTLKRGGIQLPRSQPSTPIALLMATASLAFVAGQFPWFPTQPAPFRAQVVGLALFLLSGGLFFLAADLLRDRQWLRRVTWLFLGSATVIIVLLIAPGGGGSLKLVATGAVASLFWTWLVAIAFGQAVFNRSLGLSPRLALLGLTAAAFWIGLFHSRSWASGWVPAAVAVFAILLAAAPAFAAMSLASGAALAAMKPEWITFLLFSGDQQYSLLTRVEAIRVLTPIISVNPLLGLGPANYYHYTSQYPIMGWYVNFNSHNNYIDILAQTGIVGLLFFLWFGWACGRLAWNLRKHPLDDFSRAYVYGAFGGLAGTLAAAMLGDWVIPFVYNVGVEGFRSSCLAWIFLGGLAALDWNVRNSS